LHLEKAEPAGVHAGQIIEVCLVEIGARLPPIVCRPVSILKRPVAIGQCPAAIGQRHRAVIGRHRAISGRDSAVTGSGVAIIGSAGAIFRRACTELRGSFPKRRDGGIGHLAVLERSFVFLRGTVARIGRAIPSESPHIPEASDLIMLEGFRGPAEGFGDTRLTPS
jgi:hypothetical protein